MPLFRNFPRKLESIARAWKPGHAYPSFSGLFTFYWGKNQGIITSAGISTTFKAFKMFSRTAFRLQGASKAIRSFSVAAQVNSYAFAASFQAVRLYAAVRVYRVYFTDFMICTFNFTM